MDWGLMILVISGIIAYLYLLKITKQKYITARVKLHLETREQDSQGVPLKLEQLDKFCHFIVTPVPGMEFLASDVEGAVIKRVVIDEIGGLEVICQLTITDSTNEFAQTCEHFTNQGWHKKHYE